MKKEFFLMALFMLFILTEMSCKHSAKDPEVNISSVENSSSKEDDITKRTVYDRHGDKMEIISNDTKNSLIIRLNGNSYDLKKNNETETFSTNDNLYQFIETKNDISFIKKNVDMVLFHTKKEKASSK